MRELVVKIDMNNAAFGESREEEAIEAARILKAMAYDLIMRGKISDDVAFDVNGNCVGSIEVIETP
jgi:hypothetical protein